MSEQSKQVVSDTVDATPEAVFAVLADPSRHPEFDGSGMCASCSSGPMTGVGQSFVMNMSREDLGQYQIRNTITTFDPGRAIAWKPSLETSNPVVDTVLAGLTPGGHVWIFELEPVADGRTKVTHTCDWSGVQDDGYRAFFPFISSEQMSSTVSALGVAAGK